MIAHCPSCGTHYKHDPPKARVRARCGRCDTEVDLARLSPYRIVSSGRAPAIGPIARSTEGVLAARTHDIWQDEDPLPQIPEMAPSGAYGSSVSSAVDGATLQSAAEGAPDTKSTIDGRSASFALWMAAGAIAGTGLSWTLDGATVTGVVAGSALGAVAGWGWLRWTSPK